MVFEIEITRLIALVFMFFALGFKLGVLLADHESKSK